MWGQTWARSGSGSWLAVAGVAVVLASCGDDSLELASNCTTVQGDEAAVAGATGNLEVSASDGRRFTVFLRLGNRSSETVTLQQVRPATIVEGVELVGTSAREVTVADPGRTGVEAGFPPTDAGELDPVEGTKIAPDTAPRHNDLAASPDAAAASSGTATTPPPTPAATGVQDTEGVEVLVGIEIANRADSGGLSGYDVRWTNEGSCFRTTLDGSVEIKA